jgi:hypothetical protein
MHFDWRAQLELDTALFLDELTLRFEGRLPVPSPTHFLSGV